MTTNNDQCRRAFEEWFEPSGKGLDRDGGDSYKFMTAYAAWNAWQAGWEAAPQINRRCSMSHTFTPTPWVVWQLAPDSDSEQRNIITTADGEQEVTGIVYHDGDAERIVRCVNAHDYLVAALQDAEDEIVNMLDDLSEEPEEDLSAHRTLSTIRAAIMIGRTS